MLKSRHFWDRLSYHVGLKLHLLLPEPQLLGTSLWTQSRRAVAPCPPSPPLLRWNCPSVLGLPPTLRAVTVDHRRLSSRLKPPTAAACPVSISSWECQEELSGEPLRYPCARFVKDLSQLIQSVTTLAALLETGQTSKRVGGRNKALHYLQFSPDDDSLYFLCQSIYVWRLYDLSLPCLLILLMSLREVHIIERRPSLQNILA